MRTFLRDWKELMTRSHAATAFAIQLVKRNRGVVSTIFTGHYIFTTKNIYMPVHDMRLVITK